MTSRTTFFGSSSFALALLFTIAVGSHAQADERSESILRAAIAMPAALGSGEDSCEFSLSTPPLELAPAPGKFQNSALHLKLKKKAWISEGHGGQSEITMTFVGEPNFDMSDREIQTAAFDVVTSYIFAGTQHQQEMTANIRFDATGKVVSIAGSKMFAYLDGKPATSKQVFVCR